ncbi:MAG: PLP-dependent cysteine synthase family protein [Actinomycetota bacterium]
MLYEGMAALVGNTPMVQIPSFSPDPSVRIWVKLEGQNPTGSVKDRIAREMIVAAEESGALTKERILLEPTSGNTGISLAFIAQQKGYRLMCVMPETASSERSQMIKLFGGEIVYSPGEQGSNGAIRLAKQMAEKDPEYFMLYQYGNPGNPGAHYKTTGPEILRDLPTVTHFIAGLGTGGTLTGVGRFFRDNKPEVKIIAAEPEQGDLVYGLRSLEDGFIPEVLDQSLLSSKIKVNSHTSVQYTQALVAQEGIFSGISCGATVYVARRVAERLVKKGTPGDIVCLFADGGWKYLSTNIWDMHVDVAASRVEYMPW